MIQRIQTLFLIAVILICVALFLSPICQSSMADTTQENQVNFLTYSVSGEESIMAEGVNLLLPVLNIAVLLLAGFTIFLYKNRLLQVKLCMLAGIFSAIMLMLIFFLPGSIGEKEPVTYLVGTYLIALQVLFFLLARRSIIKDEKLVRSSDRIR